MLEVLTVRLSLGKFWCLDWRSLIGGGRLREVVAYERWSHMDVRLQPYTWYKNTMLELGRTTGTRYPKLTSENRCCVTETLETFRF